MECILCSDNALGTLSGTLDQLSERSWETVVVHEEINNSKEQQGEIRKPSSVINAKKQRKTTERKRLEISSRKLEIPREYFMQKISKIKDRAGMDLTETEDIKKRRQEDTE